MSFLPDFSLFLTRCHIDHCIPQHEFLDRVSPGLEFPFFLHIHLLSMSSVTLLPKVLVLLEVNTCPVTFSLIICRPCLARLLKFNSTTHSPRPFPLNLIFYLLVIAPTSPDSKLVPAFCQLCIDDIIQVPLVGSYRDHSISVDYGKEIVWQFLGYRLSG